MGYYTNFDLTLKAVDPAKVEEAHEYIKNLNSEQSNIDGYSSDYMYQFDEYDDGGDGTYHGYSWKWYDHDDDLLKLSLKFPDVLFILDGEDEEGGDIWRSYYKNGKTKRLDAEIVFPDYDPKEL